MSIGMWELCYVLPNLAPREPLVSDSVAIVGPGDERLAAATSRSAVVQQFLNQFSDIHGHKASPGALLVREGAPQAMTTRKALYAFRNLSAIASIIGGVQESMHNAHANYVTYSNYFDLYPVTPSIDGEGLVNDSPLIRGWIDVETFHGQSDPTLVRSDVAIVHPDATLNALLQVAWARLYSRTSPAPRHLIALFRSLEVAYQAASVPRHTSIHEYGSRIALWVSAIEILAHPPKGNVNLLTVIGLLSTLTWRSKRLQDRRYVVQHYKTRRRVPYVAKLYKELYRARNTFIHGNRASPHQLFPFSDTKIPALPRFAPLLYKAVLLAYLQTRVSPFTRRVDRRKGRLVVAAAQHS